MSLAADPPSRRSLERWLPAAACLALACRPAASEPPESSEPAPPTVIVEAETAPSGELAGEVVIAANAWLHAHPGSEIRFRLVATAQVRGRDATRFAVVADHGEWVELEAGRVSEWPDRACVEADELLWKRGLHLFVEREALLPVTTVQTEVESSDDGTSVSLRPGTPLGPAREGDGWRLIDTWEGSLYVPVRDGVIGQSFVEWGGPRDQREVSYVLRDDAYLEVAGEHLVIEDGVNDYLVGDLRPARDGDQILVELDTRCFHAVARTAAGNLDEPYGVGGLGLVGTGRGSGYTVAVGTTVFWADGSEAGQLREAYGSWRAPTDRDGLRCFEQVFGHHGPADERRVELCFDAADVVEPVSD